MRALTDEWKVIQDLAVNSQSVYISQVQLVSRRQTLRTAEGSGWLCETKVQRVYDALQRRNAVPIVHFELSM